MRLLLDSHALLWYTLNDPQLSPTALALILDLANDVLVSPANFWEIAIKVSIGKLQLNRPFQDFTDTCLSRYGFGLLPIQPAHAARVATLPFLRDHKDPFDRMLVAQALVETIGIVSGDTQLDAYGVQRVW